MAFTRHLVRVGTAACVAFAATGVRAQEPASSPAFYAVEPELRALVGQALAAHPGLKELAARYRSASERAPQVSALPDPMVNFTQMLRSVETRVGPQRNTVMVTQAVPWFGKRDLQGRIADASAEAARQAWEAARRDVIQQVKTTFYNLGYVDVAIAVTEQEQSILEHYEQLARDRYAGGAGLQQAVIRVQAELTRLQDRFYQLRQQRLSLAARLNTLLDQPPDTPVAPVRLAAAPLEAAGAIDLESLFAEGARNRPEVLAAEAMIDRGTQALSLAARSFRPDLMFGAGFVNVGKSRATGMATPADSGKNAWTVSFGVSLPIWRDKLNAGLRQAGDDIAAEEQRRARLVNDIEFDVRDQAGRLQMLASQLRLFQDVLIPQAEEAQRSTEAAYQTGQAGVLDLLDSERVLLDARLAVERQRVDFLIALTALERAIGTGFPK